MSSSDLLPPNATTFEKAESATDGARVLAAPAHLIRDERQPQSCQAIFLPLLAWERSLHHWKPGDAPVNRSRIGSAFGDHGSYGSPHALELEISTDTDQTCFVREFNEFPGGAWPDFKVDLAYEPGLSPPAMAPVAASALKRKNVREHFAGVRLFGQQPPARMSVGAASFVSVVAMVLPATSAVSPAMTVGASTRVITYATVLPLGHS